MSADAILRKIADRQLNLVARRQALDADVSAKQWSHREKSGILQPLYRGVSLFGAGEPTYEQEALGAVLACAEGAFVGAPAAATIWKIIDEPFRPIDVIVPLPGARKTPGVKVRRSRAVGRSERTVRGAVPISTVARTLLDLAACMGPDYRERALDQAMRMKLITPRRLLDYLVGRNAPGSAALRALARDRDEHGLHDTDFEKDTERLLLDYGLPRPERQFPYNANGRSVRFDLFYPDQRVAIEPNGEAPHWGRERWQADHDKRIAARIAGIDMLEFTWDDVHTRQLYVVTAVGDALGLKPSLWVPKCPQLMAKKLSVRGS